MWDAWGKNIGVEGIGNMRCDKSSFKHVGGWLISDNDVESVVNLASAFGLPEDYARRIVEMPSFWGDMAHVLWKRWNDVLQSHSEYHEPSTIMCGDD